MTEPTFALPGSERRLDSRGLQLLDAHEVQDGSDVSEDFIQVTVLLRPDPAAGEPATPTTRDARRAARRPSQADVGNVIDYAKERGLTVVDRDRPPRMVVLSGTVKDVTAAFGTSVKPWDEPWPQPSQQISSALAQGPDQPRRPFRKRPMEQLKVPATLQGAIKGVFGIDDRKESRMQMHIASQSKRIALIPETAGPEHTVGELAGIYGFPDAARKGDGQTIAILSLGGRLDRDAFAQYCESIGVKVPEVVEVPVDRDLPDLGAV